MCIRDRLVVGLAAVGGAIALGTALAALAIIVGLVLLGTALTRTCPISARLGVDTYHEAADTETETEELGAERPS